MSEHDELMSLANLDDLDEQILREVGEENLLERMQEQKDKKTEERAPWMRELREDWFSTLLLFLSFLLTEMTALYLGLAPTLQAEADGSQSIHFNTDVGHIATTLVYMLVFPAVTELSFWIARKKFNQRESGNFAQQASMGFAAGLSLIAIIGTGVSGFFVAYSVLGSVGFLEVPPSVQNYLIWVIPILVALLGLNHWIYESNSGEAKLKRLAEEEDRKAEISDRIRERKIERLATRAFKAAAIRSYAGATARGLLSQREADEGLAAGLSLIDFEKKLRRDLNGDGKIGEAPALPSPAPQAPPIPEIPKRREHSTRWTLRALLSFIGIDAAEARDLIRQYRLFDARSAYMGLEKAGYIPPSLTVEDFMPLFCELAGVPFPTWDSVPDAFNPTILPPDLGKVKQEPGSRPDF